MSDLEYKFKVDCLKAAVCIVCIIFITIVITTLSYNETKVKMAELGYIPVTNSWVEAK